VVTNGLNYVRGNQAFSTNLRSATPMTGCTTTSVRPSNAVYNSLFSPLRFVCISN